MINSVVKTVANIEDMESKSTNRHKKVRCNICNRAIRSDHVNRHARTHADILAMSEDEVREELRNRHTVQIQREEKRQKVMEIAQQENIPIEHCNDVTIPTSTLDTANLERDLLQGNQDYLDKIQLGKEIVAIIDKGTVREESLSGCQKEALDVYRKQKPRIDIQNVQLRIWQQQLMQMIATPSNRQVLWICGTKGNEGKSWFQGYLETFYGYARVVRLDLRNKASNVLHALSKRPLQTTDIFLFNDTRASNFSAQSYAVLEQIKDGCAISSKYNSTVLTFKVPNVLIVFSNIHPNTCYLSKDRWRVYSINKDGLKCSN